MSDKFVEYSGKRFPLDEGMTLDDAKDVMARHFPELAEPKVETKKEGALTVYVFSKQVGRKGAKRRRINAIIRIISSLNGIKLHPTIEAEIVRLALSTSEMPETDRSADQIREAAVDLGHEARTVRQIGDALLSLPPAGTPSGSIL